MFTDATSAVVPDIEMQTSAALEDARVEAVGIELDREADK